MSELILPRVTVILRGYDTEQVLSVVEQLAGTRINSVEVASNSPRAMESIEAAHERFSPDVHVGAGTVLGLDIAKKAVTAGAEFMLSPVALTQEIIDFARSRDVITVPGAFSPTEIQRMVIAGADIVKVFPAGQLGPDYIRAVQAPLGHLPLMVVGGVDVGNVQSFFDAGATYAGIGSGVFNPRDIVERKTRSLGESVKRLEDSIAW